MDLKLYHSLKLLRVSVGNDAGLGKPVTVDAVRCPGCSAVCFSCWHMATCSTCVLVLTTNSAQPFFFKVKQPWKVVISYMQDVTIVEK
jgi:hypothetical protein